MSFSKTGKFLLTHPLSGSQKLKSFSRFFSWQLRSRCLNGPHLINWMHGTRFYANRGDTGITGNIYAGLHEFNDMAFVLHTMQENDLFADIGANVGAYTLLACSVKHAHGVAFEPAPVTFGKLLDNVKLNGVETRVQCINAGVGSGKGKLHFTTGRDTTNHVIPTGVNSNNMSLAEIDVVTVDDYFNYDIPLVMKIDVEGFELPVINGANRVLADDRQQAVIMELNGSGERYGFDETRILKKMTEFGYLTYTYMPFERKLIDLFGKNMASGNTLFIKNKHLIEDRITTAAPINIYGISF